MNGEKGSIAIANQWMDYRGEGKWVNKVEWDY